MASVYWITPEKNPEATPCSKAVILEQGPKFFSPSPAIGTSQDELIFLNRI